MDEVCDFTLVFSSAKLRQRNRQGIAMLILDFFSNSFSVKTICSFQKTNPSIFGFTSFLCLLLVGIVKNQGQSPCLTSKYKDMKNSVLTSRTSTARIAVAREDILFLSTSMYDDTSRPIAHLLKEGDSDTIASVAHKMACCLPENCVLIPAPGHNGHAKQTLVLANMIASQSNTVVVDILKGSEREPNYDAKKAGRPLSVNDMGIYMTGCLPEGKIAVVIDNVVDTGTTAFACASAIGSCIVLSYAMTDKLFLNQ